jgi:hypothetical protein
MTGRFALISSVGKATPGTNGTLAALMPRLARYRQVGVFEVRETPTRQTSASLRPQLD